MILRHSLYAAAAAIVALAMLAAGPAWAETGSGMPQEDSYGAAPGSREPSALAEVQGRGQLDCADQDNVIHVVVDGVESNLGTITADLHGERPEEFLKKGKKILRVRVPARPGKVRFCMRAPKPGVFAIGIYHDQNANKRFDKDLFGLPAEPYGISNNPRILFGPPSHEESAFVVGTEGTEIRITLKD